MAAATGEAAQAKAPVIVVAASEGLHAEEAFRKTLAMLKGTDAEIHIVHVRRNIKEEQMSHLYPNTAYWHVVEAEEERRSQKVLGKFKDMAGDLVNVQAVQLKGDVRHQLVEYCSAHGADMLVMGRRGASPVRRLLTGSVTKYCAHHAPCAVAVHH